MKNLSVKYLGMELKSPIIASSCGLTSKVESIKKLEAAGAGAVVLKSLFEEQILGEISTYDDDISYRGAAEYLNAYVKENNINNYISFIKEAKQECSIPIIASICCKNGGEWVEFAKEIEGAGADALEVNIFFMPTSGEQKGEELEEQYLKTVAMITASISIPVSVKINGHFTNPINIARELYFRGAKGVVMFNRLYDPDIDIENMSMSIADILSTRSELRHSLRWIAMSSAVQPEMDYSASTGVHNGEDAIKMLLAGATTVQVCSTLYNNGINEISAINNFIGEWMERHNFISIEQFMGCMNYKNLEANVIYERSQFMKYYSSHKSDVY